MNYQTFCDRLHPFQLFSLTDVRKAFPAFDSRRLVEWQQKGYLRKVINRWYIFTDVTIDEPFLYRTANRIYQPSYVSLETAFSFYGLIPEGVYTTTSVATVKTQSFDTFMGTFTYRKLKPTLFFGYRVIRDTIFPIKMADPEKAVLDYLYLNPRINHPEDWEALRWNVGALAEPLDESKLHRYLLLFENQALEKRVTQLLDYLMIC